MPDDLGKTLIIVGLVIIVLGLIFILGDKIPWFRNLPGDVTIEKKNFNFYFPIMSCLFISAILSGIIWLLNRK